MRHVDIAATADGRLYDSVVLVNVLEHIDDDENALGETRDSRYVRTAICACSCPRSTVCTPTSTTASATGADTGGRSSSSRCSTAPVSQIVDARYINTVGALAWWLFVRQLGQVPTQPWSIAFYDRVVVPVLRRAETKRSPRFGQSLLGVGILHDS